MNRVIKIPTIHPRWAGRQIGIRTRYRVEIAKMAVYVDAPGVHLLIDDLINADSDFIPEPNECEVIDA